MDVRAIASLFPSHYFRPTSHRPHAHSRPPHHPIHTHKTPP
ncbi:Protein CBG25268 [Caenorhabditis briggsae]|uniref:Protein CBG25268 n=1 Tax=Caenorhabditis briggsae TaxID=6238 RepID=B6III6_CAEBR|nr:Protein CBG25268 [Caenorhabditis briggsae]CAR99716.1 Protein CBG25268 [Caenorhabditis briggsae]